MDFTLKFQLTSYQMNSLLLLLLSIAQAHLYPIVITAISEPEATYQPQDPVPVVTEQDPVPIIESTPGITCRTEGLPYAMCNW
jgi:hypothetical protein